MTTDVRVLPAERDDKVAEAQDRGGAGLADWRKQRPEYLKS